jgi:site-specific DNA-methyltransferase (adenine-specific)
MSDVALYNPDVLSCLANLSSDEVFTPPSLANKVLDMLPGSLWSSPDTKILDPVCKSGVFLREAAKRLDAGLAEAIPDKQARINHILTKQLFGIAITDLTALIARRSLYCSKYANGKYSVCTEFKDENGNIKFDHTQHAWKDGKCEFCGSPQAQLDRSDELETHAYQFIHTHDPQEIFSMKFDVIVGNPPYQLSDGGYGRSASPIYQLFVQQAKKLNPRFLTMIVPSRWFAGGKGLDSFRKEMLQDNHLTKLVAFEDSADVFPGVDIPGGICYFLWERDRAVEECVVTNISGQHSTTSSRKLSEHDVLVRDSQALSIIQKIRLKGEPTMNDQVSSRKPFGLATTVRPMKSGELKLKWTGGVGPFDRAAVPSGEPLIDKWKVIASRATPGGGRPGSDGKRTVLSSVEVLPPGTICTEAYLVVGAFDSEEQASNLVSYMKTKLFRFLLAQVVVSHDLTKDKYMFVPVLDSNVPWTDGLLCQRYGLTEEEMAFIDSRIRPMDMTGE